MADVQENLVYVDHSIIPDSSTSSSFLIKIVMSPYSQGLFWKRLCYILVSWFFAVTNHRRFHDLRQAYYCVVRWWEVWYGLHWIKIYVHSGANLLPVHLDCWQNAVSCSCRLESPDFWPAVNWGSSPASRGYCVLWLLGPFFRLQSQQLIRSFSHQIFLTQSTSCQFFFFSQRFMWLDVSLQIIQDNLCSGQLISKLSSICNLNSLLTSNPMCSED